MISYLDALAAIAEALHGLLRGAAMSAAEAAMKGTIAHAATASV
ncbi:hypothetical protein [Agrobacterium pusense]